MGKVVWIILLGAFSITWAQAPDTLAQPDSVRTDTAWSPSPTGAVLRSLAVPGWGQLYNDQPVKAGVVAGLEVAWTAAAIFQFTEAGREADRAAAFPTTSDSYLAHRQNRQVHLNQGRDYLWGLGLTVFYAMVDGYVNAQLYHFDAKMDAAIARDSVGKPRPAIYLSYHWK